MCVDRLDADHFVFDLEDSVAQSQKVQARDSIARFLEGRESGNLLVRIHSPAEPAFVDDVELMRAFEGVGIVLPKITDASTLHELADVLDVRRRRVIGLVESLAGVEAVERMVDRSPIRLFGLGIGVEDMLTSSFFTETELSSLVGHVKCRLAVTCLTRGIVPIDGICPEVNDVGAIARHCRRGRSTGMVGKFTIHPRQIPVANQMFWPDSASRAWAERIMEQAGPVSETGYQRVGDLLITPPKVKKARWILNQLREPNHG